MYLEILIVLAVVAIVYVLNLIFNWYTNLGKMRLDPAAMYSFTFAATFPDEKSASACVFAIASLNVPAVVTGSPNGSFNVDITYVGKGDEERFATVSDKLKSAAAKHGGLLWLSGVGAP